MKKTLVALLVIILVGGGFFIFTGKDATDIVKNSSKSSGSSATSSSESGTTTPGSPGVDPNSGYSDGGTEGYEDPVDKPAAQVYASADQAITAVQNAAKDYDDIVLEQFVEPGEDCTWCESFYSQLTSLMKQPDISEDERAYYSEILAISGKPEHIQTLISAIEESGDSEDADIYAESLELTIGGDDTVKLLTQYVESDNELLQESAVAAITNQGSELAARTLYEHTKKVGDPDGYYSLGIGLAELIPDQETLPYLQELASKRDEYSHLSMKALMNYGHEGLVMVMDTLISSPNRDFDKEAIVDLSDHYVYEESDEAYLDGVQKEHSDNEVIVGFIDDLREIGQMDKELDEEDDLDDESYDDEE